jgi:CheY-like chemotaxis protein
MTLENDSRPIIGFINDLMFAPRLETVADRLGFDVILVERAIEIAPPDPNAPTHQYAEHLVGPGAVLLDKLTRWRPALIVFDLNNAEIPWKQWVALIKSVPATRRIPVLCFGSHKDVDSFRAAKEAGADAVLARSRFVAELAELIQRYARMPDPSELLQTCQQQPSPKAIHGIELFNRGEYFEAHEALEAAWNEDETPGRELYRAILQVAVAYLQIERGNYNGAVKMFLRVRQWIDPLPDECRGVDVARLRSDAKAVHKVLDTLGRSGISDFDRSLLKPVRYKTEP